MTRIDTKSVRNRLPHRREPYWVKRKEGHHVGYRAGADTWLARARGDDGKYRFHALGSGLEYNEAVARAEAWFNATPVERAHVTVGDAITTYISGLAAGKGRQAAHDAEIRLTKHVGPGLRRRELDKLTTGELEAWRDALVREDDDTDAVRRSRDTANRTLSTLKAALNAAFRRGECRTDAAWRRVQAFRNVAAARIFFPSAEQVGALLASTKGAFHNLLHALVVTGCRYGELAGVRVRDLDPKQGTLRVSGKTGAREMTLADDALAVLTRMAKGKPVDALLLPREDGDSWGKSHQHRPFREACDKAALPADFVLYSLRHYYISMALLAGVNAQVVAENVGTSMRMIEKHYGKFLRSDRRAMLNRVCTLPENPIDSRNEKGRRPKVRPSSAGRSRSRHQPAATEEHR